jgi:hypothetical protein
MRERLPYHSHIYSRGDTCGGDDVDGARRRRTQARRPNPLTPKKPPSLSSRGGGFRQCEMSSGKAFASCFYF